mmetsp:Transcript_37241/g.75861  ORF Transcript_37241/g.75861 Transcript_37241/m.75861 type:complete len:90 (-) Transcript_37241:319-588(-)
MFPANGNPAKPPRLKFLPYILAKSSAKRVASSSEQSDEHNKVLEVVKPRSAKAETTLYSRSLLVIELGNTDLTMESNRSSNAGASCKIR